MRGVYDYKGECFGYITGDKLYDLSHKHSGYVLKDQITDLLHRKVWNRDRDGLYDEHWVSIGYIGKEISEDVIYDER